MKAMLALPEDDGSFAFVLEFSVGHQTFVFFGLLGPDPKRESQLMGEENYREKGEAFRGAHLLDQSIADLNLPYEFTPISVEYLHALLRRAQLLWQQRYSIDLLEGEHWAVVSELLPPPKMLLQEPPTLPDAKSFERLLSPTEGVCVAIPNPVLFEGMGGIALTKYNMNQNEAAVELLPVVIDTTADLAAQKMFVQWWSLALEVVGLIADAKDTPELANAARYNASLMGTVKGSVVPILRAWTEHFLIRATAMARIIERQKKSTQDQ